MTARRRAGVASLGVGLALVLGVRLVPGLGGPPLYDGVVPVGPYQWLAPGPSQQGGAQGAKGTVAVIGGKNDILALATPESLPQAQVFAIPGALLLPAGATSLSASIEPVPPPGKPADGALASNVYRFVVQDQSGAAVTAPASAKVSVVLRSADMNLLTGVVERWDGSRWVPLKTPPPGVAGAYLAVVTEFGDYAVVLPGAEGSPAVPGGSAGLGGSAGAGASGPGTAGPASPRPTPTPGDVTASDGRALVALVALAGGVALAALLVLLVARRRGPPGPPPLRGARRTAYRGAHPRDRD